MTQSKKGTKSSKGASNFIKVPDEKVENDNANLAEESQVKKRKFLVSGSKEVAQTRGVVYVSHIPHGFYENQMRKYFEQVCRIMKPIFKHDIKSNALKRKGPIHCI